MMKPFEDLDLSALYLRHNITYYAHNHATQPDGINAAVKELETQLKAFDLDDYPGSATNTVISVDTPVELTAAQCVPGSVVIIIAGSVAVTLPIYTLLPVGAEILVVDRDGFGLDIVDSGALFFVGGQENTSNISNALNVDKGEFVRLLKIGNRGGGDIGNIWLALDFMGTWLESV